MKAEPRRSSQTKIGTACTIIKKTRTVLIIFIVISKEVVPIENMI
jgi:hypothetical protein